MIAIPFPGLGINTLRRCATAAAGKVRNIRRSIRSILPDSSPPCIHRRHGSPQTPATPLGAGCTKRPASIDCPRREGPPALPAAPNSPHRPIYTRSEFGAWPGSHGEARPADFSSPPESRSPARETAPARSPSATVPFAPPAPNPHLPNLVCNSSGLNISGGRSRYLQLLHHLVRRNGQTTSEAQHDLKQPVRAAHDLTVERGLRRNRCGQVDDEAIRIS